MINWFTSDTHFGHANIIEYCNRPFSDVEEMDDVIIDGINGCVTINDTLYHLGDFSFGKNNLEKVREYRGRIRCKNIHLILGNHDYSIRNNLDIQKIFSSVSDLKQVKLNNQKYILCHYPLEIWNAKHHGSVHLYGHTHEDNIKKMKGRLNVGVDLNNFYPHSLKDIKHAI